MEEMSSTSSFILELPVRITPHDAHILDLRLDAGRQLYNACLGEVLRRLDLMRESKVWKEARTCRGKDERRKLFYSIQEKYGFSDYEIQAFAIETKNACWIGDHLDTHVCQKIGTRAFRAVEQYAYGKRGRPRFKSKGRFRSLEGKSNATGIRFRDGCTPTTNTLVWGRELSQESDKWKHGAFTYALIEGIEGKTDLIKDNKISMKELDTYVSETVPKITNGSQHPITDTPDGYVNFPVAVLE